MAKIPKREPKEEPKYMSREMRHVILKVRLLHYVAKRKTYAYALIEKFDNPHMQMMLKKSGQALKNDIYNNMKSLEKGGYIKSDTKVENRKVKVYYGITEKGKEAEAQSKMLFKHMMEELNDIMSD